MPQLVVRSERSLLRIRLGGPAGTGTAQILIFALRGAEPPFPGPALVIEGALRLRDFEDQRRQLAGERRQRLDLARSIHLDPLGYLQPIYTWEETGNGRRCSFANGPNAYGDMFRSDARIIAHELGHAFEHNRDGWLHYFRRRRTQEYSAMVWENRRARGNGQPERCRYSREF
jgi:hypothetical protein